MGKVSGTVTRFNKIRTNTTVTLSLAAYSHLPFAHWAASRRRLAWTKRDLENAFEGLVITSPNPMANATLEPRSSKYIEQAYVVVLDDPLVPYTMDANAINSESTPGYLRNPLGL